MASPSQVLRLFVGTSTSEGVLSDGSEVIRRRAEWERQVESLDQKELELHQSQLRLIREQTATFIRDLNFLRQEVGTLRQRHDTDLQALPTSVRELVEQELRDRAAAHDALLARAELRTDVHDLPSSAAKLKEHVDHLEQALGESADRHAAGLEALKAAHDEHAAAFGKHAEEVEDQRADDLAAAGARFEQLHGRLAACEAHGTALGKMHSSLQSEKQALMERHASLKERVQYVEGLLGDFAEAHAKESEQLVALAQQARQLEAVAAAQAHHAAMGERLGYIEGRLLCDCADRQSEELVAAGAELDEAHGRLAACERHSGASEERRESCGSPSGEQQGLQAHHAGLQERLTCLERLVEEQARELEAVKTAHERHLSAMARHCRDVEAVKAASVDYVTVAERLSYVEALLGDSADKHAAELAIADSKHSRVAACEKHSSTTEDLQQEHRSWRDRKASLEEHRASIAERIGLLEEMFRDIAGDHDKEVSAFEEAHSRHAMEFEGLRATHEQVHERFNYIEQIMGDSADRHAEELASVHDVHDRLHHRLSACEADVAALGDLRRAHGSLPSGRVQLETRNASVRERVEYLEGVLNDSAHRHAEMLEAAHAKVDEMHGRVSTCEKTEVSLLALKKAHGELASGKAALASEHASTQARVDYLEGVLGDVAHKHAREIEALRGAHDKHALALAKHAKDFEALASAQNAHRDGHASLAEHVAHVEQRLGGSPHEYAAEVAALHRKADQLHTRLAEEAAARERHQGSLKEQLAGEQKAHHASIHERIHCLELLVGDSGDKHALELAEAMSAQAKLASELMAKDQQHYGLEDRLASLERALGEAAALHSEELRATHGQIDSLRGRLGIIREAWGQETPRSPQPGGRAGR